MLSDIYIVLFKMLLGTSAYNNFLLVISYNNLLAIFFHVILGTYVPEELEPSSLYYCLEVNESFKYTK